MALPALTLAIAMSAKYLRQVRATVLDELSKDYVLGARARGVKFSTTLIKSVMKASLVTIITLLTLSIGSLLGGTAIVGGKGTLTGCVLGTLLIVLVENSMILIGVPVVWKDVFVGLLIVIGTAVSAYQATHSGTKRRTRTQAKEAQHNG